MKRLTLALVTVAAVVGLHAAAQAQPPFGMMGGGPGGSRGGHPGSMGGSPWMGGGPGRMLPVLLQSADLTEDQRGKVHEIMKSRQPNFRRLFGELHEAHEALGDRVFGDEKLADGDLDADMERVMKLRGQLMREGTQVVLKVRRILTPEQLAKVASTRTRLEELRSEMRELFGGVNRPRS